MKVRHLFLALALMTLLTIGAAAYSVPNLETDVLNPYYGMNTDVEGQADFLKALDLFRGTDKGYELNRSMNRCEAAAMLVRLLGREEAALAENNSHPFTDVPQWAAPYVGWLWKNGLTKGMGAATYGAGKAVTAEQYLIFLSRTLQGKDVADDWWKTGTGDAIPLLQQTLDRRGFLRGDAVSLSVWALKTNTSGGETLAKQLLTDGAFSQESFRDAAIDVYESTYTTRDGGVPCRETAGVAVSGTDTGLTLADSGEAAPRSYLFGLRKAEDGLHFVTIDCKTLSVLQDAACADITDTELTYLFSHKGFDYLESASRLYCWDGVRFTPVCSEGQPIVDLSPKFTTCFTDGNTLVMQSLSGNACWRLDGASVAALLELEGVSVVDVVDGTALGIRAVGTKATEFVGLDLASGRMTVLGGGTSWLTALPGAFYWGEDGLWQFTGGKLVQLTDFPMDSALSDGHGSTYFVGHTPGFQDNLHVEEFPYAKEAGDTILHLSADGTLTTALSAETGHNITITHLDGIRADGSLQFSYRCPERLQETRLTYALEQEGDRPCIRVVNLFYAYGEIAAGTTDPADYYRQLEAREQQRLNDLGIGIA